MGRNWVVTETAHYSDPVSIKSRVVERGLRRRAAERSAREWQAASDRNKLLVLSIVAADKRKPLPNVTYRASAVSS